jgi:predicted house-cleaning noncanonical NTP pyrophosphatase (MazG superfamily)
MIDINDIDRAVEYLRDSADKAAQARAERLYLDEFTKHLKAKLMKEHIGEAVNAQEREALADPRYLTHLEALKTAIHNDEKYRFLREAAQVKVEVWRSQLSWAKTQESIR